MCVYVCIHADFLICSYGKIDNMIPMMLSDILSLIYLSPSLTFCIYAPPLLLHEAPVFPLFFPPSDYLYSPALCCFSSPSPFFTPLDPVVTLDCTRASEDLVIRSTHEMGYVMCDCLSLCELTVYTLF